MSLDPRKVPIYRPYADEMPWTLLPDCLDGPDPNLTRIAKLGSEVIGVYAIEPVSALHYRITALVVAERHRRQGLGRWLLGHAIGICESKGAREISAPATRSQLFANRGFERTSEGHRLLLTPE